MSHPEPALALIVLLPIALLLVSVAISVKEKRRSRNLDKVRGHLLRRIVGHQPPVYAKRGWYSPGEQYGKLLEDQDAIDAECLKVATGQGRLVKFAKDGIGTTHCRVECECARCGEKFTVARVHLPREAK